MKNANGLPVQELLEGEYLRVTRLHKDLHKLSNVPHRHDHYEMLFVVHGEGKHSINFKVFDVLPNRVYFLHPGQIHIMEPFDRDGWLILFGEELYKRFLIQHPLEDEVGLLDSYSATPSIDLDPNLTLIFKLIVKQLRTELTAEKQDADLLLHYVSLLLLHGNRAHAIQHPKEKLSMRHAELFYKLKHLIDVNFKQQHLAAYYSSRLSVDIKLLNRICRQYTGFTVFELLQERLLTESKIQLQTFPGTIKEISYALGFNDPAFFGRFFKKHTQLTPAQFKHLRSI